MTVRDLKEMLEGQDDSMEVHIAYNFGDYWRTQVAPKASDGINEIYGEISKGCIYLNGKWAEIVDEVKPIEKWSVGSYVVFFNNSTGHNVKLGTIDKIKYNIDKVGDAWFEDYGCCDKNRLDVDVKWFATLEEAEVFSKSLIPLTELQSPIFRYNQKLKNMKQLKSIKLTNIIPEETYLVSIEEYERYGGEGPDLFKATGKQIIKKIEETFDFRSWMDTEVEETGKEPKNPTKSFLKWAMDMNGDGDDYIQVFKF